MWIKKIELKNYRNYDSLKLEFSENLNIIIGDNAQGKTNLLESIYVLAVTKSFLSIKDKGLIKFNNDFSLIKGLLKSKNGSKELNIKFNKNGKFVRANGKDIKKLSDYVSIMNVVIFSSDNIRIFKDSPSSRRKYFDIQISQINKKYLRCLSDYNIILRQRNEFLKIINTSKKSDIDYFSIINNQYADLAISIFKYRNEYIKNINKYLNDMFYYITGNEGLKLCYSSNIDNGDNDSLKEILIEKLDKSFNNDVQYKMTFIGPNRDDFYFNLNDKNLSLYGSQGQIRSAVLALKLSEVKLFTDLVGDSPILLLDDMFSELDINKRNNILKYLNENVQTIITTTDIENIGEEIRKKANVYKIEEGKIISREIKLEQEGDINE